MKNIKLRFTWLLIVIEFAYLVFAIVILAQSGSDFVVRFYELNSLNLNIIFITSPIVALLLYNETDRGVFIIGVISLFSFILFTDFMCLLFLFKNHENLGFAQWLYIIPATLVSYIDYLFIKSAKIYSYCSTCRARLKLKGQSYCHNCGRFLTNRMED